MKTSQEGRDFITRFEGCFLLAYRCPANLPTIGVGHISNVQMGDVITQEQADDFLEEDLKEAEHVIENHVTVPLEQCQHDALGSLIFNIGGGAFVKSTLLEYLNEGDLDSAAEQFLVWNRGGGRVLPGLVKRRIAERILFLFGRYS